MNDPTSIPSGSCNASQITRTVHQLMTHLDSDTIGLFALLVAVAIVLVAARYR
jgi:hypothetical protein